MLGKITAAMEVGRGKREKQPNNLVDPEQKLLLQLFDSNRGLKKAAKMTRLKVYQTIPFSGHLNRLNMTSGVFNGRYVGDSLAKPRRRCSSPPISNKRLA